MKNYDDALKKAKKLGKIIIAPEEDELQIDIDSEKQLTLFRARFNEINDCIHPHNRVKKLPSDTDGHYHIYIQLENDTPIVERVALQLFLGSDPVREYLSLCLIDIGDKAPILFFENPDFSLDFK